MIKFVVDNIEIENKSEKITKISAYYNEGIEYIDKDIIVNKYYKFKKGNTYKAKIIKEYDDMIEIDKITQIDIDKSILDNTLKILEGKIEIDDIKYILRLKTIDDIKKYIDSSKYTNKEFIKNIIINSYNANNLKLLLNNNCKYLSLEEKEFIKESSIKNYKNIDIAKLYKEKTYYLAQYGVDLKDIKSINKNNIIYSKIILAIQKISLEGHIFVYLEQLKTKLQDLYEDIDINNIIADLEYLQEEGLLVINENIIYLKEYYLKECSLIQNLKGRLALKSRELTIKEIEEVNNVINSNSFKLNKEQEEAILESLLNPITIISGQAGTGKSTIVNLIAKSIKAINEKAKVEIASLAGKAVNVLNNKIEEANSKTIHRLFKIRNERINDIRDVKELDFLIIDEVSMLNLNLMNIIFNSVEMKTKVILIGDINQIEAIGVGMPINDMINSNVIKIVYLKDNNRQKEESLINLNATKILNNEEKLLYDKEQFTYIKADKNNMVKQAFKEIEKLEKDGYNLNDISILTLDNSKGEIINEKIRSLKSCHRKCTYFAVKDRVIQTINDYDKNVYNGEIGTIVYIEKDNEDMIIKVNFGNKIVEYNQYTVKYLKLAYSLTVHKMQGSQNKVIILLIDDKYEEYLYKNLIYTAITRAEEKFIVVGNIDLFNKSIGVLPKKRNSMIAEELRKIDLNIYTK